MEKIFYSIAEVAEKCGLEKHVVRFWESEFPEIKPDRRQGRRYYRDSDLAAVMRIKDLLYKQGFTIKGAKKALHAKAGAASDNAIVGQEKRGLGRRILEKFSFSGESSEAGEGDAADVQPLRSADNDFMLDKLREIDKILAD